MGKSERDLIIEKVKRRLENPLCDLFSCQVSELEATEEEIEFIQTDSLLDDLTGGDGLSKESLTLLIGGTGDGKSLLLTHLASKMSETKKILYVSFETNFSNDS